MVYTVKKLATISGVSVRTLHWYDEIGLLKPAYYGENGYRYYEQKQLLNLQQILFFRELGFPLEDIQKLVVQDDFDQLKALETHRKLLKQDIDRGRKLISTIDKTIMHLKGKQKMTDKEIYHGFDTTKQHEYEQYLVNYHGKVAEDLILQSQKRTADWDKRNWDDVKAEGNAIYAAVAACLVKDLSPRSDEVQVLIHQHFQMIARFYDPSKDVYMGLAELYCEHPDFRKFFDPFHPELVEFMAEAMRFYASRNL